MSKKSLAKAILFYIFLASINFVLSQTPSIEKSYEWGAVEIGGGGFVSGIVAGKKEMYLRTDVGGAYRYDYEMKKWVQLFSFIDEANKGYLSVKGIAIDPNNEKTVYFLCGCAYFSNAKTAIFKTTDGGETFEEIEITDLIQVHGNGNGRECIEPIAVNPDDSNMIYVGGDVTSGESGLIKSTDGGKTWKPVKGYDDLGLFTFELKWPSWTNHMVRSTLKGEYASQNGISNIKIYGGKVYVGTSVTGVPNIHVADVNSDKFTVLSNDLPTKNFPLSITDDGQGTLFFTYIANLAFDGTAGGAFKYEIATKKVTDISPVQNAIGMIAADRKDPKKLLARTCGKWLQQWYEDEWIDGTIAWGDHFFRSLDGGLSWTNITPGQKTSMAGGNSYFISLPLEPNGYKWIYGKAIHWGSSIIIDPRNPDKIFMTSGNGVFVCANVWEERNVQMYFDPKGVEEVVALDMISVKGGKAYSAIGDYDGFIHSDIKEIGIQYKPNIGSTSAIAVCPQDPKFLVRFGSGARGYYSKDGGETWTNMTNTGGQGGKAAITKITGGYRIFHTSNNRIVYTDDYGEKWNNCTGIGGDQGFGILVEESNPNIVYVYTAKFNSSWSADKKKEKPTIEDSQFILSVSNDGGKTFKSNVVGFYGQDGVPIRIAYLSQGKLVLAAGKNGAYITEDYGKTFKKLDSVFYCKSIGYGAPQKKGNDNTLFMYGKSLESDPEGLYRSTDSGKTWVLINTKKLYGGTGNGNFIVGDMNTFGLFYMSTVGCGIIYGKVK